MLYDIFYPYLTSIASPLSLGSMKEVVYQIYHHHSPMVILWIYYYIVKKDLFLIQVNLLVLRVSFYHGSYIKW